MNGIALIGFMGSGKSTIGPKVAETVKLPFLDLDETVVKLAGADVAHIFTCEGEAGWRLWESKALQQAAKEKPVVLACGGGVILSPENRTILERKFLTVYLKTSLEVMVERLRHQTGRPLLDVDDPETAIAKLYTERRDIYESVAHVIVTTDGKRPEVVAKEVSGVIKEVLKS